MARIAKCPKIIKLHQKTCCKYKLSSILLLPCHRHSRA